MAIALSADGNTLAVGAIGESSDATGVDGDQNNNNATWSGAAYVFTRSSGIWAQQAYIKASNTEAGDAFGFKLTLSGDGNTLAVVLYGDSSGATGIDGDPNDNGAGGGGNGAVYVYTRSASTWRQQAYVKASNTGYSDGFATSLALNNDGNTLAVGAPLEDSIATGVGGDQSDNSALDAGAVYLY